MLTIETLTYKAFETRHVHRHDKTVPYYVFARALEGRYELHAGSNYADCQEGEAFFTAPNIPLRIQHHMNPGSGKMRVRYLHFTLADEHGLDPFAFRKPQLRIDCETAEKIDSHIRELCRLPQVKNTREKLQEAQNAFAAIAMLENLLAPVDSIHRNLPPELLKCLEKIAHAKGLPVALEKLWHETGQSRSVFFNKFREYTGTSPSNYILHARINYAARLLLRHPELSVKELAATCGWQNPYHFSRAFRKIMGTPPGEYRAHSYFDS